MKNKKAESISFFVLFSLVTLIVLIIFKPFWELLVFAMILAVLFYPIYNKLATATKTPGLSALFTVVLIVLIIAGPVFLIGQQIFYELIGFYKTLNLGGVGAGSGTLGLHLPAVLQKLATDLNLDLHTILSQYVTRVVNSLSGLLSSLGFLFGSLVVSALSVFFLLRDGKKIKELIIDLLPLSQANENILFKKISMAINGVVKGQFLVVLTMSTASFIGFYIFGLPNALLWACGMFIAAFVPTFGTSLVFVPAVAFLYFSGHVGTAVGMTIWACLSVFFIDNLLSAKIVSSRVKLHPLLTIFGILGGVVTFGVLGVLLGPIIMAIFVALVDIYRTDMKELLEK